MGWSIGNVLLDFTGGFLSVAQLLLDGATLGWGGLVGDPIKFALGFVSVFFDVVFMVQHYCVFTSRKDPDARGSLNDNLSRSVVLPGEGVDVMGASYAGPPEEIKTMHERLLSRDSLQPRYGPSF